MSRRLVYIYVHIDLEILQPMMDLVRGKAFSLRDFFVGRLCTLRRCVETGSLAMGEGNSRTPYF